LEDFIKQRDENGLTLEFNEFVKTKQGTHLP